MGAALSGDHCHRPSLLPPAPAAGFGEEDAVADDAVVVLVGVAGDCAELAVGNPEFVAQIFRCCCLGAEVMVAVGSVGVLEFDMEDGSGCVDFLVGCDCLYHCSLFLGERLNMTSPQVVLLV